MVSLEMDNRLLVILC